MYITKSLFVEYRKFPKLAWRKKHDEETYKKIRKIETREQEEHIMQLGQQVEDAVRTFFEKRYGTEAIDFMPEVKQPEDLEYEEEDHFLAHRSFNPEAMMEATLQAIRDQAPVLYQPTFLKDNCLVRADFMIRNDDGSYTLCEVKAKTSVRKEVTDDGEKKKIGQIKADLLDDMSFQKRLINQVLTDNKLPLLKEIQLRHLNPDYIKDGELSLNLLLTHQRADAQQTINIIQRNKPTEKLIDDTLLDKGSIEVIVQQMKQFLVMDQETFDKHSLRSGTKFLEYFGKTRQEVYGTVMGSGIHHSNASTVQDLFYEGKKNIADLDEDDIENFNKNGQRFIDLYQQATVNDGPIIDSQSIQEELTGFNYPICFYDYESVSVPIPFMDKTFSYQQVVVQYSLHKLYEDGSMKHYGGLFVQEGSKNIEEIVLPDHPYKVALESEKVVTGHYTDLLEEFLKDIGDDINHSTFIVWSKAFENTRNKEIAKLFPHLDDYLKINDATYDLRDIFSKLCYFDHKFKGSSSIKKVLPALVPEMDYSLILDEVTNGSIAMMKLKEMIDGTIVEDRDQMIEKLLRYCGLDSLAMVRIYQELLEKV